MGEIILVYYSVKKDERNSSLKLTMAKLIAGTSDPANCID
jgi:hypothetical protein